VIEWYPSGGNTINGIMQATDGTEQAAVSASDSTYGSGGIGFTSDDTGGTNTGGVWDLVEKT
jgi:hypothetical protein